MSGMQFLPCMALDAICFLEKSRLGYANVPSRSTMAEQMAEIRALNALLPPDLSNDPLSMSSLSLIISTGADSPLEDWTLDDLIRFFQNPDTFIPVVKARITTGFVASYVHPMLDMLADGYAAKYAAKLEQLRQIGFEAQYRERILPLIENEIRAIKTRMAGFDCETLFARIAVMKNCPTIPSAKIYISLFSYPTAFTLYNGSFLSCFGVSDYFSLTAHELMHGFADGELTEMYRQYTASDAYLGMMHDRLIRDFGSGDEEEFVVAAQYDLCLLSGRYERSALLAEIKGFYGGCCPVAAILFDLLSQEPEVPVDYNTWLKKQFADKRLPECRIRSYIDQLR